MTHQVFGNRLRLDGGGSWFQEGVAEYICTRESERTDAANLVKKGRHVKLAARIILFLALAIVLVFAAFNSSLVSIDALFGELTLPLGVALVGFFALGSLAGALGLYLAVVLRLKRELRRSRASGSFWAG